MAIDEKGHPVPLNSLGELHCLSWHLRGKCKTDCRQNTYNIHAPLEVINHLIEWCTIALKWGVGRRLSHEPNVVSTPSRTASAVGPKVTYTSNNNQIKDHTSAFQDSYDIGKNINVSDYGTVCLPTYVLHPPTFIDSLLNPMTVSFISSSSVASTDTPSLLTNPTIWDTPSLLAFEILFWTVYRITSWKHWSCLQLNNFLLLKIGHNYSKWPVIQKLIGQLLFLWLTIQQKIYHSCTRNLVYQLFLQMILCHGPKDNKRKY